MDGLTPAASEGGARGLFSSGEGVMVLWPRGPCLIPFARGSGASFDGGKVLFARLAGPRLYRGRVPFARGVFIHKGLSDGERVRGAPRRAPDTPGSRPTKSPLRGSLASISSLQVGRDTASCLSRPQARVHAGLTWLVNSDSAILMPDPTPQLHDFLFLQTTFVAVSISHTHSDTSVT